MFGNSDKLLEDINYLLNHHLEEKINQAFSNSFNLYLEKFRELVDHEKEIIEKYAAQAVQKIDIASSKIQEIGKIENINFQLTNEIEELIGEIRKRDAIIERKNKQILRLKGRKNEI